MPIEVISNIYLNFGILGLIVIAFFVLVVWTIKNSKLREDKLYSIIDTLSAELPEMRGSLERIERKINKDWGG